MNLVAGAAGGHLYTSTDAGVTWTAYESAQQWHTVASSADGTKLVAGAIGGQLYTSVSQPLGLVYTPAAGAHGTSLASVSFQVQDSGGVNLDQTANTITFNVTPVYYATNSAPSGTDTTLTITEGTPYTVSVADFGFTDPNDSPANGFQAVTITALPLDGTLTLNGAPVQAGESITLPQAGVTWTARGNNQERRGVASSADGMNLVAGTNNGQLYTSTDAGVTWTARESNRQWFSVASSADGMNLVAGAFGGQLYTSTDAGVTWTARESNRQWISVASSADGTQLVAAAHGGQLYTSTDAGVTWTAREITGYWITVASSADGTTLVAGANDGLYTSVPQPLELVYTPAAGAHGTSLASVSFQVQDSGGTANGGVNLDQTANTITFNVTAVHQPVTAMVTSSAGTSTYGDAVTFTATVTPSAGGTTSPVGQVEFFDNGVSIGATTSANPGSGLSSTFVITLSTLTAGSHSITALFTGGNNGADSFHNSTSADITQTVSQKTLTGFFGAESRTYDGTTDAVVTFRDLNPGVVGLDEVFLVGGTASFDNENADQNKTVTLVGATLTGAAAGNYTLESVGTSTANIAKAVATVSVLGSTGTYDAAAHGATGSVTGVAGDLAAAGSSLNLGLSFTDAPGGTANWSFTGGTNYTNQSGSVAITINAKAISYTIGNASHVFGSTVDMATVLGTTFLTGVNGENLDIAYSSTGNTVASLVGNYAIHGSVSDGTGMLSNYDVTINSGTLTVTTPSVITIVQDGVNLIIVGTDSCDTITVNATNPNSITVTRETHGGDGDDTITGGAGDDVICGDVENDTPSYSVGAGGRVIVYGIAGGDNICLTGTVNLEAHGGDGDDTITGSAGHDVIWGDQGNDTLTGSAGNDVLVGGSGSDRLVGSAGHDLLISDELMGDHNGGAYDYAALRAIDDNWAANWSVDSDLESTSGDVLDESGSADTLTGSSGHDWFILGSTDKITDIKSTTKDGDKITY
jgi:Ca2+-binding RTX toxin-like protein